LKAFTAPEKMVLNLPKINLGIFGRIKKTSIFASHLKSRIKMQVFQ